VGGPLAGRLSTVRSPVSHLTPASKPHKISPVAFAIATAWITRGYGSVAFSRLHPLAVRWSCQRPTNLIQQCFLFSPVHIFQFRFALCATVSHPWTVSREQSHSHHEAESGVDLKRGVLSEQFLHMAVICLHHRVVSAARSTPPYLAPQMSSRGERMGKLALHGGQILTYALDVPRHRVC
jgi:hypothetical protein